jgi:hypothetical protein
LIYTNFKGIVKNDEKDDIWGYVQVWVYLSYFIWSSNNYHMLIIFVFILAKIYYSRGRKKSYYVSNQWCMETLQMQCQEGSLSEILKLKG